ncbi:hypothetical protein D9M68_881740 [compost metagenome]
MGMTEEKQLHGRVSNLALEILEVNLVVPVIRFAQGRGFEHPVPLDDCMLEVAVRRRQAEHLVTGGAHVFDETEKRGDHSQGNLHLLTIETPTVAPVTPRTEGVVQLVVEVHRVSENGMRQSLTHGADGCLGCGELHVSNPHGHQFRRGHL